MLAVLAPNVVTLAQMSASKNIAAGALAGVCSLAVCHPLDVVVCTHVLDSVNLFVFPHRTSRAVHALLILTLFVRCGVVCDGGCGVVWVIQRTRLQTSSSNQFKGAFDVVAKTVKSEGPLALYKGLASPLLAQVIT